jgi:hypothetical protein
MDYINSLALQVCGILRLDKPYAINNLNIMNTLKNRNIYLAFTIAVLMALEMGCRPSVREVVKVVSIIPLNSSRDEVKLIIFNAYSKKYPDKASKQGYMLTEPPRPLTYGIINAEITLISQIKKDGSYVNVFPSELYDKLSEKCYYDGIGLVADTSEGDGSVTLYYDSHTNYIGFMAESQYEKKN